MLTSLVLGGLHQRSGVALPTGGRADPAVGNEALAGTRRSFFLSLVPGARWYPTLKPRQFFHTKTNQGSLAPYTKTKTIFPHCTKIKNFFIVVLIPKPFLKFPDKLIGKGCPTTGVLSMWNEIQRIASLHLAETLRPTALPHDSALHLYITCKLLLSVRLGISGD